MSLWSVIYSEQAKQDLHNIYQYIAYTLLMSDTADKQADRIMTAIESLNEMPERNPKYDKEPWYSRGLRKLMIDNYIAFYLPIENNRQVLIVSIMYGGRNIQEILPRELKSDG